jgi:hypothetical protein
MYDDWIVDNLGGIFARQSVEVISGNYATTLQLGCPEWFRFILWRKAQARLRYFHLRQTVFRVCP